MWGSKGKRESNSRSRSSTPELSQPHQPRKAAKQETKKLQAGSKGTGAEPAKMRSGEPAESTGAAGGERRKALTIKLKVPHSREASPGVATPSPPTAKAMHDAAGPSGERSASPAGFAAVTRPRSEPAADLAGPSGTATVAVKDKSAPKVSTAGQKPGSEKANASSTQPAAEAKAPTAGHAQASHSRGMGMSEDAQASQAPAAQVSEAAEGLRRSQVTAELAKRQEEKVACQKPEAGSKAEAGALLPGQTTVAAMELDKREKAVASGASMDSKAQDVGRAGPQEAEPIEAGELTGEHAVLTSMIYDDER